MNRFKFNLKVDIKDPRVISDLEVEVGCGEEISHDLRDGKHKDWVVSEWPDHYRFIQIYSVGSSRGLWIVPKWLIGPVKFSDEDLFDEE